MARAGYNNEALVVDTFSSYTLIIT